MGKIYLSQYTPYANAARMLLRRNRQLTHIHYFFSLKEYLKTNENPRFQYSTFFKQKCTHWCLIGNMTHLKNAMYENHKYYR